MREFTCEEVKLKQNEWTLIDVRTPEEFVGELGHIEGARLLPLGNEVLEFLKSANPAQKIIFVCRSGARSGQVTLLSEEMGFTNTVNMVGGMLRWNELKLPIQKGV
ncbi:rhodanese-like domain-containing protein [Bdellovibrio sp. BCCA]|uniref:rhodanese-like domain-containing protein n=1 Tax=Bdellovibrio sp. BCCA TaxID=3136281 RepID=UPI0030F13392